MCESRRREADMDYYDPFQTRNKPSRKEVVYQNEGVTHDARAFMVSAMYGAAGPSPYDCEEEPSIGTVQCLGRRYMGQGRVSTDMEAQLGCPYMSQGLYCPCMEVHK